MTKKKSVHSMLTAGLGAAANVLLNLQWIPAYGVNGAAMATLASYLIVFIVRVVDTQKYVRIQVGWLRIIVNFALVMLQSFLMIQEVWLWPLWSTLLTLLLFLLNMGNILEGVRQVLRKKKPA